MSVDNYVLSESERELLPSAEDVRFYRDHGWYISRRLLSDEEVNTLDAASERFYSGHRDRSLPRWPDRIDYWTPDKGDVQRHNDYIHYESSEMSKVLRKPLIGAVAARLARVTQIRIFQATLIFKPPRADEETNIVPWHFDRDYWATSTSERMLTAFIPFHHCDESMGTITMIDGSSQWVQTDRGDITARHFADRGAELDEVLARSARYNRSAIRKVPMLIPRGHMSFHHCRTYHGSGHNGSSMPRRAISLHLQDGENGYREFRLGDGRIASYNHDVLVRIKPDGVPDYADPEFCPVIWHES
jgi:hypothetical protein